MGTLENLEFDDEPSLPRLYFDLEGSYDLYYVEFRPDTDKVYLGTYRDNHDTFPQYPDNETDESCDIYEKLYDIALKSLHHRAMNDVQ